MALATTTIGELNPGGPLQGTDNFVIERIGGNNFRITADEVSTFIGGGGASPTTTQGDLIGRNLTVDDRIPIGTNGQVLTVTTVTPTLMRWETLATNFYQVVQDEGVAEIQRTIINFVGAGVSVADVANVTTVTIGGGAGEINLGANVGSGTGLIFRDKIGVTLNFKTLIGGTNVTVTNNADDITIDATGSASPLTTQGDLFGRNLTVDDRIPIGTPGQILEVSTVPTTLIRWIDFPIAYDIVQDEGATLTQRRTINFVGAGVVAVDNPGQARTDVTIAGGGASPLTTLGDLYGHNLTVDDRIPIGTPGQHLTVLTAQPTLIGWENTPTAYITIQEEGIAVTARPTMNFIGTMVTAVDNGGATRTDITIASPLTTQGDLFARNLTVDARLPIGSPGQVLTVGTVPSTLMFWSTLNFLSSLTPWTENINAATFNLTGFGFLSRTGVPSTVGAIRLATNDLLGWRNSGNTTNQTFGFTTSGGWEFVGESSIRVSFDQTNPITSLFISDAIFSADSVISQMTWLTRGNDGSSNGVTNFAQIEVTMEDRASVNLEDGSMKLKVRTAGSLATYISFNDASSENIEILKPLSISDGINIIVGTTTGTKFGTSATQKIGFFDATPIIQPVHITDASGGATVDAEARTAINALLAQIAALGLQASS